MDRNLVTRWWVLGVRLIAILPALLWWGGALEAGQAASAQSPKLSQVAQPAPPVAGWIASTGANPARVGLIAVPIAGGSPLIEWNPGQPLNPASTMKLLSTYVALTTLGPDYRWVTSAHLDGTLKGGVLEGNLVLRGGGDPKLVVEDLTEFVARMRAAGLREIRGNLVIDDGLFDLRSDPGLPLDGDASQPYNVGPHAALMNFKSVRVVVRPTGDRVKIALDPPLADVRVVNELKLAQGACQPGSTSLWIRDGGGAAESKVSEPSPAIRVGGQIALACGEQGLYASVLSHRDFIHGFFKASWIASGGAFSGRTAVKPGAASGLDVWQRWVSPRALAEIAQDINKFSNNVMTRQVLLSASASSAAPGSPERVKGLVADWLAQRGLHFPELVLDNGSGLSRDERISAASLGRLLAHAANSHHADLFRITLPQVGIDGTMRSRLQRHPVAGRAWIKTGSLRDVKSIAGYLDAASGRRYAVVMLINGEKILGAQPAQDAFLRWVYENG
jgi:D-alanyl-D-alanine carboxypeptidase/D-alanyl-D-alanine-endopeptidase (penicillin-binding protein 4)